MDGCDYRASWLGTLKIQTLLTPGKAHREVLTRGQVGDIVMNGSVMKHRDSVTPPPPNSAAVPQGTGCITPSALGKMTAWCSRFAASAASFLITFASLELTVSCLLLSKGDWILKPAARKWNCWNSRCFHQLWRKGRQRDDWLLGNPFRLIKQKEWWLSSSSTELSVCGNLITPWLMHFSVAAAPWQTVL